MKSFRLHTTILFSLLIVSIPSLVRSQQSNTLYLLHQVPQSGLLNPAVRSACKWNVGIPVLTSTHISYSNTALSYNDLAGTDTWNLEGVFDQMHRVDLIRTELDLQLLSIGYNYKSFGFSFHISDRLQAYQLIPRDLAETFVYGNGPFIGETARFNALRPGAIYHREYSLGVSKVVDSRLTLGVRADLRFGKAGLYSNRSRINLSTGEDRFEVSLDGDYQVNASFPLDISVDANGIPDDVVLGTLDPVSFLLNRGNPGFTLDLGAIYRYDEKLTLSASLLDLGLIRWRTDLNNLAGSGSIVYTGTDPGAGVISDAFLNEMTDSILNAFDVTATQTPFTSTVPAQLFLGGSYHWKENITLGAVNRNLVFRNKIHSSLTLSARVDLLDRFLATVSWSYLNNSVKNVGAGLAWYGKGFNFHLVTDNFLGFFYPFDTRTVNLRMGFNVIFGCPKGKKEVLEGESYGNQPKGGDCSWATHRKISKKYRKKSGNRR